MHSRFKGNDGQARLVAALAQQAVVGNDKPLADAVANHADVRSFDDGDLLIKQDGADNDLFFILTGVCEVLIGDRVVAERGAGEHVGEMAALDPSAPRSATVRARGGVVAAVVSDNAVATLGDSFPRLYRRFAIELGRRLRQRGDHVRPANNTPRLFLGSSVESLVPIQTLQRCLEYDPVDVVLWTDNLVEPGHHVCDSLLAEVRRTDFAVFHASGDDQTWSRERLFDAPRDNIVFELGMFMGVLEKERVFLLLPRSGNIKIPSDLLGITPLSYDVPDDPKLLQSRLGSAALTIREAVKRLGVA